MGHECIERDCMTSHAADTAAENVIACVRAESYLPAVHQSTAGGPVELKLARTVRDRVAIQAEGLGSSVGSLELHKAISRIADLLAMIWL